MMDQPMTEVEPRLIYKTSSGFIQEWGYFSHQAVWDAQGKYIGQHQVNCIDTDADSLPVLFFKAAEGEGDKFALTDMQMAGAIPNVWEHIE